MKFRNFFLFFLLSSYTVVSCKKNNVQPAPDFSVTNTWECQVDGVTYSGSIDTSFIEISGGVGPDTLVYCTGTSSDKKANIHFRMRVNRTGFGHDSLITQDGSSELNFDTSSSNQLWAWANLGGITFHIEGLNGSKCKGRFYGTAFALQGGGERVVKDGKFSFDIGRGNNEPKFLYCKSDNIPIRGYVNNARFVSNTLILDGLGFHADSTFQLMIRTGSQVKPGVYQSQNGDVGFKAFRPSIVTTYVSDAIGNLTVTIQSVSGNIVEGIFSGQAQGSNTGSQVNISNGKFSCRIKNYTPQQDSVTKWGFSESNDLQYPFFTWGGNILKASRSQDANFYYVTLQGESDNGNSIFKLKLRSVSPVAPGIYQTGGNYPNNLDSLYFYCYPMNSVYYQPSSQILACQVDSIDNQKVVGRFYGKIWSNGGSSSSPAVRRGSFRGSF